MRLVPGPPGVELGGHSYCCDSGNDIPRQGSNPYPPRFSIDENYPRSCNGVLYTKIYCVKLPLTIITTRAPL